MLSDGLKSPHCKLEQLRLSGCQVSEEGCVSLASALSSNPVHLRELDLTKNHPGPTGVKLLSALQKDPHSRLEMLRLKPAGPQWLRPLIKHFHEFTFDLNTANRFLQVSNDCKKASHVKEEQPYPDHRDRFVSCPQLLCSSGVSSQCYWEVEWTGVVLIAMSYKDTQRRGNSSVCGFGLGEQSWSLSSSEGCYAVTHKGKRTTLPYSTSPSGRVAVYVDFQVGALTFYAVSSDELVHLHTFNSSFTQPLYPAFQLLFGSSVTLCDLMSEEVPYL